MRPQTWLLLGDVRVDLESGRLTNSRGVQSLLTTKELDLLRTLAEHPGGWLEREKLYESVWGYSPNVVSRSLDTTLFRLRGKLEQSGPMILRTARSCGVGYFPLGTPEEAGVEPADLGWEYGWEVLPDGARLVSIVGTEGQPRTQLAWEFFQRRRSQVDSRWLCLTGVSEQEVLEEQLAAVLGDRQPALPGGLVRCHQAIQESEGLLLVLDDIDACHGLVSELLRRWLPELPSLDVVVSTSAALELGGEYRLVLACSGELIDDTPESKLLEWADRLGVPFSLEEAEVALGNKGERPVSEQLLLLLNTGRLRAVATDDGKRRFRIAEQAST